MNRLDSIAIRQRKSASMNILFAGMLALAAIVSVSGVGTACAAATTTPASHLVGAR